MKTTKYFIHSEFSDGEVSRYEYYKSENRLKSREIKHYTLDEIWKEIIGGLKKEVYDEYPDIVIYSKNNNVCFEVNKKFKWLFCSYKYVWSVLEKYFDSSNIDGWYYSPRHMEIRKFIEGMTENSENWKGLLPRTTNCFK